MASSARDQRRLVFAQEAGWADVQLADRELVIERAQQRPVGFVFRGFRAGLIHILGPGILAINVRAKCHVPELRQHLCPMLFVVRKPEPLMHHQHPWPGPGNGIIPDQHAFQRGIVLLVEDGFRLDGRVQRRRGQQNRRK